VCVCVFFFFFGKSKVDHLDTAFFPIPPVSLLKKRLQIMGIQLPPGVRMFLLVKKMETLG
jgi:hypothetical protein